MRSSSARRVRLCSEVRRKVRNGYFNCGSDAPTYDGATSVTYLLLQPLMLVTSPGQVLMK